MRFTRIAMIICLVFLVLFAGFTVYGSKVGNFVVRIENTKANISACITENPEKDGTTRFSVPGVKGQNPTTFTDIPKNISEGIGIKNDTEKGRYLAFSFYLLNRSDRAVDYDMTVEITDSVGTTANALRVMIVEGDKEISEGEIFAKPEADDAGRAELKAHTDYQTIDFVSDKIVLKKTVQAFPVNETVKYTVVFWLEGWDKDCNNDILGDRMKMRMDIEAY